MGLITYYYYLQQKYFITVTYYLVTLLFKMTQQFSNNVSYSYQLRVQMSNIYLPKAFKLALQTYLTDQQYYNYFKVNFTRSSGAKLSR